jgi:hypothetical protein
VKARVETSHRLWKILGLVSLVVAAWELFIFVFKQNADLEPIVELSVLFIQISITALAGGVVGIAFGFVTIRSRWLTDAGLNLARIGLWFSTSYLDV